MSMSEPLAAPPVAAPPYLLTTLGEVALRSAAGREGPPVLGPGKPLALLIYLALSPGRSANREHLADLLWSDLEPERARHALRQTLYFLRQQLGDGYLLSRGGDIHLSGNVETDRDAFLHAVDGNELEAAAELYRGPFLRGSPRQVASSSSSGPTWSAPGSAPPSCGPARRWPGGFWPAPQPGRPSGWRAGSATRTRSMKAGGGC